MKTPHPPVLNAPIVVCLWYIGRIKIREVGGGGVKIRRRGLLPKHYPVCLGQPALRIDKTHATQGFRFRGLGFKV